MNSPRFSFRRLALPCALVLVLGIAWVGLRAQGPGKPSPATSIPENKISPRLAPECCGYPFPRSTDAEIADSDVHRVLYEDNHVMFLEVINPPLLDVHMHGHPFASVFSHDSTTGGHNPDAPATPPAGNDAKLDPNSPYNDMGSNDAPPPAGMKWPTCTDSAPQAPHRPFNTNRAPNHFYRLEFLRLDGDDIKSHWKEWYPSMAEPVKPVKNLTPGPALGPNFSEQWPYPIVYDAIQAAPNNYNLLYEDGKLRLIEVTVRPGETTPMHGHPYPSVLAFNSTSLNSSDITETRLDPKSPMNGQGAGQAAPPKLYNLKQPTCMTMAPEAPYTIHNAGSAPLHFYRIEYKRIDGDGLVANWKKWYPYMMYMPYMR